MWAAVLKRRKLKQQSKPERLVKEKKSRILQGQTKQNKTKEQESSVASNVVSSKREVAKSDLTRRKLAVVSEVKWFLTGQVVSII